MRLGNVTFSRVEEELGYRLTEADKVIWDKYHSDNTSLRDNSFHIYDMPLCIVLKGEEAKEAILNMFTSDKIVNPLGTFTVYEETE